MAIKIIKKTGQVVEPIKKACKNCRHWARDVPNAKYPTMHNCHKHKCLTPPDSFCLLYAVV